ncbi:MAG: ribosome maturation factor RimM [Acidimicrobiia bacterium]|nr:ribosome maturation factor RimM [Acidimicrobiia bacterium]
MADWDSMVLVGRIARTHGLKGHVIVNPETDFPHARFKVGSVLWTRSDGAERTLTISAVRFQQGRPVIAFEGLATIDEVEPLAGQELRVPEDTLQPLEAGQYYQHQLVGCMVETVDGARVGAVAKVEGGAGGTRLVVDGTRGEIQIPFAVDICVDVDVPGKRIRIDPPDGLLELNETKRSRLPAAGRRQR